MLNYCLAFITYIASLFPLYSQFRVARYINWYISSMPLAVFLIINKYALSILIASFFCICDFSTRNIDCGISIGLIYTIKERYSAIRRLLLYICLNKISYITVTGFFVLQYLPLSLKSLLNSLTLSFFCFANNSRYFASMELFLLI